MQQVNVGIIGLGNVGSGALAILTENAEQIALKLGFQSVSYTHLDVYKRQERGWEADLCLIRPDETAGPTVARQLASKNYDCVVIGAGIRLLPRGLVLFEVVINAVHKSAPGAAIAFNTVPQDLSLIHISGSQRRRQPDPYSVGQGGGARDVRSY